MGGWWHRGRVPQGTLSERRDAGRQIGGPWMAEEGARTWRGAGQLHKERGQSSSAGMKAEWKLMRRRREETRPSAALRDDGRDESRREAPGCLRGPCRRTQPACRSMAAVQAPRPRPQLQAGSRQPSRPPWSPLPARWPLPGRPGLWGAACLSSVDLHPSFCSSEAQGQAEVRAREPVVGDTGRARAGGASRPGDGPWNVSAHVSRPGLPIPGGGVGPEQRAALTLCPCTCHLSTAGNVLEMGARGSPQPSRRASLGQGRAASTGASPPGASEG